MSKFEAFTISQLQVLRSALVRKIWREAGTRETQDLLSSEDDQAVRYRIGQRLFEEIIDVLDKRSHLSAE